MIILATHNPGKIAEFSALMNPKPCIPQVELGIPEPEETGLSFLENALLKARHASRLGNGPALADDSGLVVAALNGEPGIYSARFSEKNGSRKNNLSYLLERMRAIPRENRQAYFYCAIVFIRFYEDPMPLIATGTWLGQLAEAPQGEGGFGYDPLFFLPEYQCTAAQLTPETKNKISHRAQALSEIRKLLCLA